MALRSAKCYRRHKRPYTRISIRKPKKSYVKVRPASNIHRFEAGKSKPEYTRRFFLVSKQKVQVRHNALEAGRISVVKSFEKGGGEGTFFLKVLVYPHHVIRENPLATGAGADRFQTGMRKSFGRPVSSAAQVDEGQSIMEVRVAPGHESAARKALKIASSKMPAACRIELQEEKKKE